MSPYPVYCLSNTGTQPIAKLVDTHKTSPLGRILLSDHKSNYLLFHFTGHTYCLLLSHNVLMIFSNFSLLPSYDLNYSCQIIFLLNDGFAFC
jgi:hypothetical protein